MKKLFRRLLRAGVTVILRVRSHPLVLAEGQCVIIAPHQDDEAFGCAGLILARRNAGLPVSIIYVTDGAGSHPNHPRLSPADVAQIRRTEAVLAMRQLGVAETDLHFLDAADGTLAHLTQPAADGFARRLAAMLNSIQPSELFIPCRDDGSSEHIAAFSLMQHALKIAALNPRPREYPIWARWRPQQLMRTGLRSRRVWRVGFPQAVAIKRAVLAVYVSQTQPTPPWSDPVLPRGFLACFASNEEFFFEV